MSIDRTRFLTFKEAQERSGYAYDHLRKLVREGLVAAIEIDPRKHLIDWIDLQRYMQENPQRKPYAKGADRKTAPKKPAPRTPSDILRLAAAQVTLAPDDSDVRYEPVVEAS